MIKLFKVEIIWWKYSIPCLILELFIFNFVSEEFISFCLSVSVWIVYSILHSNLIKILRSVDFIYSVENFVLTMLSKQYPIFLLTIDFPLLNSIKPLNDHISEIQSIQLINVRSDKHTTSFELTILSNWPTLPEILYLISYCLSPLLNTFRLHSSY